MECAGEVIEADSESGFAAGDRIYGSTRTGAFAQYAAIAATSLSLMPPAIGFPAAAALSAAYGTAYTALAEIGGLKAGQWVLIHGASGGVGLAGVELAKLLGARVIAATGSPDKLAVLRRTSQADAVILADGHFREAVADLTGGRLCDLVYDPVGGAIFDESTRCVAFGGKLLVIGFASGRIPAISANIPLIKGFSVVGVRAGEYARRFPDRGAAIRAAVAALAAEGGLNPHIDRVLPLERWRDGFEAMERRALVGKVIFDPWA